jgi:hypothetical protein
MTYSIVKEATKERVADEPDGGVKKYVMGQNNMVKIENINLGILIIVILFV